MTHRRPSVFQALSVILAAFLTALALYPLSRVLLRLFVVDGGLELSPLREAFTQPDLFGVVFRTYVVVAVSAFVALIVGSTLAWLNERTDARMGSFTDMLSLFPFLLAPVAGAVGWVLLLSPRAGLLNVFLRFLLGNVGIHMDEGPFDIHTWYGLILAYAVWLVPYVFLLVSAGLRNMDPSLEEQSRVSGAGVLRTARRVTLAAIRPSLGASILLMTWFGMALFSIPAIIGTGAGIEVLSVRIVRLLSSTFPPETAQAVGLSIFILATVGLAWYVQARVLRQGRHATVGGKGHQFTRIRLGSLRAPARIFMLGYLLVAAVLPAIGLVLVAMQGFWTPNIDWGALNLDAFRRVLFEDNLTRRALGNSMRLGIATATVGIVAAAIIALYVQRSRGVSARLIDGALKLPATISNIVLAVGFILAFAGPPFSMQGTVLILFLAYLVIYFPQGSVAADAAAGQVGQELREASYLSRASRGRTFRRIEFPIMLPGLAVGWSLLFVRVIGDLTASAMLAGASNPVVGFRVFEIFRGGSYSNLAALALLLTVVSTAVLAVVFLLTQRKRKLQIGTGLVTNAD